MQFDLDTLLGMNLIVCWVSVLGVAMIWAQNRQRYEGMQYWLGSIVLQALGLVGMLRGHAAEASLPPLASGILFAAAGLCLTAGGLLLWQGLERFLELANTWRWQLGLWLLCATGLLTFTVVDDARGRGLTLALSSLLTDTMLGWLLLQRTRPSLRGATRMAGLIMCGYLVMGLGRLVLHGAASSAPSAETARTLLLQANVLATVGYTVLNILLTLSLVVMVNRRLLLDMQQQELIFSKTFHVAPYGIMLTRAADGTILQINDSFASIAGRTREEMLGKTTLETGLLLTAEARKELVDILQRGEAILGREVPYTAPDGSPKSCLVHADTVRIGDEECILTSVADITELTNIRNRLEILATHDGLTGLPNRMLLYDRFERAMARARRHGLGLAVLSLDLDTFKCINDQLGHPAGDAVLHETARRLTAILRKEDTAARLGGDEFVLLLGDITKPDDARRAAVKVITSLRQPMRVEGRELTTTASVGVALFPGDGDTIEALLRASDEALYRVKAAGRDGYALYSDPTPTVAEPCHCKL